MIDNKNTKLLVIGNGFDLNLKLSSSFNDFFDYQNKEIINKKEVLGLGNYLDGKLMLNQSEKSLYKEDLEKEIGTIDNEIIKQVYKTLGWIDKYENVKKSNNFWSLYFYYLQRFPKFSYNKVINEPYKPKINRPFYNWSDVEYQIKDLLNNTSDLFNSYREYVNKMKNHLPISSQNKLRLNDCYCYYNQFLYNISSNPKFTYNGALKLIILKIALGCGWNVQNDDIYDFLYKQLYKFENDFKYYLRSEVDKKDYFDNAKRFAFKLTNNHKYNLINFNYTTFYNDNDENKINLHSTLKNNGHPIFGIDSLNEDGSLINDCYKRFSKSSRNISFYNEEVLTKDINEIIFYSHSLSQADFSYFENIFDYYEILDNNQTKLTFKYTERHDNKGSREKLNNSVYNLMDRYTMKKIEKPYNVLSKVKIDLIPLPDHSDERYIEYFINHPNKWKISEKSKYNKIICTLKENSNYIIEVFNEDKIIKRRIIYIRVQGQIVYDNFIDYHLGNYKCFYDKKWNEEVINFLLNI